MNSTKVDQIGHVKIYDLIKNSVEDEYHQLSKMADDIVSDYTWTPKLNNRNFGVGVIDRLPSNLKLEYDSPSNDPLTYRPTYVTYLRSLATSYVICDNYLANKKFEHPIILFYDGFDSYEIIAGAHRYFLFNALDDINIKAIIFYDHAFPPRDLELSYTDDFELSFEVKHGCYRFSPYPKNISDDFNHDYITQTLEFIEMLKQLPQLHFYYENEFLFQTPSTSEESYKINLHRGVSSRESMLQFVLDYFFDISEFRSKRMFDYAKAS